MAKLTLSDLSSLQNDTTAIATLAANNALIEAALENTLSRDGTPPNEMEATLDMNSNRIINLPEPTSMDEPLRLQDLDDFVGGELSLTVTPGEDIVILCTGQSEMRSIWSSYPWTPPDNAYVWNWTIGAEGAFASDDVDSDAHIPYTGDAFIQLSGDEAKKATINITDKICADVARKYPNSNVYVINISLAGAPITCWKTGAIAAGFADIYTEIQNNVNEALGNLGLQKIHGMVWYQGTTPVTDHVENYQTDFETVMARFNAEAWFPRTTPIVIIGLRKETTDVETIETNSGLLLFTEQTNTALLACARAEPCRKFIDPNFLSSSYWDSGVHPKGNGVDALGLLVANTLVCGAGTNDFLEVRGGLTNAVVTKPASRNLFPGGNFTANPWSTASSFTIGNTASTSILENLTWVQTLGASGRVVVSKASAAPTFAQTGIYTAHCLQVSASTGDAVNDPTDYYGFQYLIDGSKVTHLGFGQGQDDNRKQITISFWAYATQAGNYSVVLQNSGGSRSWVHTYTLTATTWTKVIAVIPACEDGTWSNTYGTTGLKVFWTVQAGGPFQTLSGRKWNSGNYRAAVNQAGDSPALGIGAASNVFRLALIQIEEGNIPSGFDNDSFTIGAPFYQQGTFTPKVTIGGTEVSTYEFQLGSYTLIGKLCFFSISLKVTNKGAGTGAVWITNLPFTSASASNTTCAGFLNGGSGLTANPVFVVALSSTVVLPQSWVGGALAGVIVDTNLQTNSVFSLSGAYPIA